MNESQISFIHNQTNYRIRFFFFGQEGGLTIRAMDELNAIKRLKNLCPRIEGLFVESVEETN